eukprot:2177452-Rhodomonas_salina.1
MDWLLLSTGAPQARLSLSRRSHSDLLRHLIVCYLILVPVVAQVFTSTRRTGGARADEVHGDRFEHPHLPPPGLGRRRLRGPGPLGQE